MAQKNYSHYEDYDRPPIERRITVADRLRDWKEDRARARRRKMKRRLEKEALAAEEREKREAREKEAERLSAEAEKTAPSRHAWEVDEDCGESAGARDSDSPESRAARSGASAPKRKRSGLGISLTPRFFIYLGVLVFAFFFTQALHAKASNIFMGFVFYLPIVLLLYALSARLWLRVEMLSRDATIAKGDPYLYEFRLVNRGFLAYPFIEAEMLLPERNSVRIGRRTVSVTMSPFGSYHVRNEVRFRFRGAYPIGVEAFYVYDFFRIFRVRVDVRNTVTVLALPRRMMLSEKHNDAVSDEIDQAQRRSELAERVEVSDLRDYRPGDPLKTIHWNLSSRSEELVVKSYVGGGTRLSYIYCDLSRSYPETAPNASPRTREEERRAEKERRTLEQREARRRRYIEKAKERETDLDEEALSRAFLDYENRAQRRREARERARLDRMLVRYAGLLRSAPSRARRLYQRITHVEAQLGAPSAETAMQNEGFEADVQLLVNEKAYEDMNEYCADGVVELALAAAARELQNGNEVVLAWFDETAATGVSLYSFRSAEGLSPLYTLLATAPLVSRDRFVGALSALSEDEMGVKQIFVTAALDGGAIDRFSDLKKTSSADGGNEILLYEPKERFRYPEKRSVYIEQCKDALGKKGFRLVTEAVLPIAVGEEAQNGENKE